MANIVDIAIVQTVSAEYVSCRHPEHSQKCLVFKIVDLEGFGYERHKLMVGSQIPVIQQDDTYIPAQVISK